MSCQSIPLATKGILSCCGTVKRIYLPLDLELQLEERNLNLEFLDPKNLNLELESEKSLSLDIEQLTLNPELIDIQIINIDKCE